MAQGKQTASGHIPAARETTMGDIMPLSHNAKITRNEEIERHRIEKARQEANEQARDDIREIHGEGEDEE